MNAGAVLALWLVHSSLVSVTVLYWRVVGTDQCERTLLGKAG